MSDFVHLHCHTEYSLLDGAIRLKDLCAKAKDYGMSAAAITDHGNLYGALSFYQACKDYGLKPIIGCEVYVAPGARGEKTAKSAGEAGYHLVLLAQNLTGYHNLIRLVSEGYLTGFHYKPRVDKALLAAHSEGLVALSACLSGEVPHALLRRGYDAGLKVAQEYARMFPGRFYLELQANGLAEQFRANELLVAASEELKLPLVATNDCHYLNADDVEAHDVLLCIQTAACVDDAKRMRFGTSDLYFRPPEEMEREFAAHPEALANTAAIAESCDLHLDLKSLHFPTYACTRGVSLEEEVSAMAREGLAERLARMPYAVDEAAYRARLEYELDVVCRMGFAGYFLIVQDFINWAKDHGVPVGPGRGSAAGSLVAYALKITNLDPIPYNLLFERFLNVERISMPDIDVDFCERGRTRVIEYVTEKYGADSVAQITTFGTMKAKAAIRDVGRALGLTFAETDRIAKLVPEDLKMTIAKAIDQEPALAMMAAADPKVRKLLDVSKRLEGLSRHASTHAAGVVISDKPMVEYLPLYRGKKNEIVTQFDMKRVEKVGLVKFDFLGLRTMTVIADALDNIARQGRTPPDLDALPLDDPKTYEVYSRGDTDGIFQVESSGMRRYLTKLKPTTFEDLIAMLALYRPGPLGSGMVDEFIDRKHGVKAVDYPHPSLADVLAPTYGVIVYQEQVMNIAQVMANYSLGEGDLLRRAMGKKNESEMAAQRARFVAGCRENDIAEAKANEVFDLMEKFAAYGFNKSHSAAYALISYHTAYLKAHYPREFMAALMTSEIENQDKILKYVTTCRDMGLSVAMPDVNRSEWQFTVEGEAVRYGLGAVKNVGGEAIREIVEARKENGPFTSLLDLCCRVNMRKVTKRVLEHLIKSGAMGVFGITRAGLFAGLERVAAQAQKRRADACSGQVSLLSLVPEKPVCLPGLGVNCEEQTLPEWPDNEKLAFEKESLGFYLSSHPLMAWRQEMRRLKLQTLAEAAEWGPGIEVRVAVLVTGVKEHLSKKGKMAFCQVEDLTAAGETIIFSDVWTEFKDLLTSEEPLLVTGRTAEADDRDSGDRGGERGGERSEDDSQVPKKAKLLVDRVALMSAAAALAVSEPVAITAREKACCPEGLNRLAALMARYPGSAPVYLDLVLSGAFCRLALGPAHTVAPCPEFWREVEEWRK